MGMCCSAPSSNKTDVPPTKPRPPPAPAEPASPASAPAPPAQPREKPGGPRAASRGDDLAALRRLEAQLKSICSGGEVPTEPLAQTDDTVTQVHRKESLEAQLKSIRSGEDRKATLEAQLKSIRLGEDRKATLEKSIAAIRSGEELPTEPLVPTDGTAAQVPQREPQQSRTAEVPLEPVPPDEPELTPTAPHEPAPEPADTGSQHTQA